MKKDKHTGTEPNGNYGFIPFKIKCKKCSKEQMDKCYEAHECLLFPKK